jgi:hypothetical protein
MPYPFTPCGQATPETAIQPFQGWPARRAGNLRPSSLPWTPHVRGHAARLCSRYELTSLSKGHVVRSWPPHQRNTWSGLGLALLSSGLSLPEVSLWEGSPKGPDSLSHEGIVMTEIVRMTRIVSDLKKKRFIMN